MLFLCKIKQKIKLFLFFSQTPQKTIPWERIVTWQKRNLLCCRSLAWHKCVPMAIDSRILIRVVYAWRWDDKSFTWGFYSFTCMGIVDFTLNCFDGVFFLESCGPFPLWIVKEHTKRILFPCAWCSQYKRFSPVLCRGNICTKDQGMDPLNPSIKPHAHNHQRRRKKKKNVLKKNKKQSISMWG